MMKRSSGLLIVLGVISLWLSLGRAPAFAANVDFWWSGDGQSAGGGGTWDTTNLRWYRTSPPATAAWTNSTMGSDIANFPGPSGTVTIDPSVTHCRRFKIHGSGYVIGSGTLISDQAGNAFVISSYQLGEATVYTSFQLSVTASNNIRIRTEGESDSVVLNLHGDYKFTDATTVKWLDLESSQDARTHTINFYGRLLDTPGAEVRLRFGYNNNTAGSQNTTYNIYGASTFGSNAELWRGTVRLYHDNALGASSGQVTMGFGHTGGTTIRLLTAAPITIAKPIYMNTGTGNRVVGGATAHASEFSGWMSLAAPAGTNQVTAAAGGTVTFSGIISGSGGAPLEKIGAGTVIFTGPNTYTVGTVVKEGTLLVNNTGASSGTGTGTVTVNAGATLGGTGRIAGDTTVNGTLAPGASPGTLRFDANLTLASTATLAFELNGEDTTVGSGVNDLVIVGGNLTLDGTLNVTEVGGSFMNAKAGDTWRLFNYTGNLTDNGLELGTMPALPSGWYFQLDTATAGQINLKVIPEPNTMWLVLSGLGMGVLIRRRRR